MSVETLLQRAGLEVTRANYIRTNWAGDAMPAEWTPEHEAELPEHLQDWSLFEQRGGELVYIGPAL